MLRKKEIIKKIQKRFKLSSFEKAEKKYNIFMEILQESLDEGNGLKLEKIGIIKKVVKKGREINIPTKKEKIITEDRVGLSFKEDNLYKHK